VKDGRASDLQVSQSRLNILRGYFLSRRREVEAEGGREKGERKEGMERWKDVRRR